MSQAQEQNGREVTKAKIEKVLALLLSMDAQYFSDVGGERQVLISAIRLFEKILKRFK